MSKPNNFVTLQMLQNVIKDIKDGCAKKADIKFHISADNISPAALFGGTWEKIEGKFLLAAGGGYALGENGGEKSVTLSKGNLPALTGKVSFHGVGGGSVVQAVEGVFVGGDRVMDKYRDAPSVNHNGTQSWQDIVFAVGNDVPHNNMPPYIAVNIWKRVA